jgi:hypothetical protein
MTSFPGCSSLFCGAKQPQQMSWPTGPSRQFKGTQRYHKKQYLSIQQRGVSPPLSLQLRSAPSLEFWPPYADYQKKTEREIPVVVLDPIR